MAAGLEVDVVTGAILICGFVMVKITVLNVGPEFFQYLRDGIGSKLRTPVLEK